MRLLIAVGTALLAASTAIASPAQQPFLEEIAEHRVPETVRAADIVEAFRHAWTGYMKYAFPHDELYPVTNGYGDSRNGWGASAVDALSTAIIMEQGDIVSTILDHIAHIDFTKTNTSCSLFETTIRYLGGMLSGYDLLTGPFKGLNGTSEAGVQALLNQSKVLADTLKFGFDTRTGIPVNDLNITAQTYGEKYNGLATIGTLALEWTRLSDLLGDPTYSALAQKGELHLLDPKPAYNVPFPGLLGDTLDVRTGELVSAKGGWIGGDDSYYEYLLKMYVYDPVRFKVYKDRWLEAADSTIRYLTSHPKPRQDLTFVAAFDNKTLSLNSQHLACFDGGNFLLGGAVLGNQTLTDYGLALVDGCHATYNSTITWIGPETFGWDPAAVPAGQERFFEIRGFYITSALYDLRPEVLESYYYAWRLTGADMYRDWAWDAFLRINMTARTPSGFSDLSDVNAVHGGSKGNLQESFLFAEVMKYAYMIHVGDAPWQVAQKGATNQFVFNTEAHPIRVR